MSVVTHDNGDGNLINAIRLSDLPKIANLRTHSIPLSVSLSSAVHPPCPKRSDLVSAALLRFAASHRQPQRRVDIDALRDTHFGLTQPSRERAAVAQIRGLCADLVRLVDDNAGNLRQKWSNPEAAGQIRQGHSATPLSPAFTDELLAASMEHQVQLQRLKLHRVIHTLPDFCSLCAESMQTGQTVLQTLCRHTFHRHCLLQWLSRSTFCPHCKQRVDSAGEPLEAESERLRIVGIRNAQGALPAMDAAVRPQLLPSAWHQHWPSVRHQHGIRRKMQSDSTNGAELELKMGLEN
mmetsp:Transcript_10708/g.17953  ORF Transcript_10708/g.17953 Transcript_10708/m.17953 type:complete len:294 (-) Transcript_10708:74-955(-)